MGRYTTVQAYADNNSNVRAISYDQATGSGAAASQGGDGGNEPAQSRGGPKVEKVDNPYGSTAGAGSGEFHVYRHARAREMARWKTLDKEEKDRIRQEEFEQKVQASRMEEDRRTAQRRKKRQRQKEAKERKKNLKLAGVVSTTTDGDSMKKDQEDEFTYTSMHAQKQSAVEDTSDNNKDKTAQVPFANDGSFLEIMKKKLEEESQKPKGEGHDTGDDADAQPPSKKRAVGTS